MPSVTYTAIGSDTWVAPADLVGTVFVECWGGGGSGGYADPGVLGGGGGGGGAYAASYLTLTPGATYNLTVGESGVASNFDSGAVVAACGSDAAAEVGGAGGTTGASTYNYAAYAGGAGATAGGEDGGGGGSAGGSPVGNNGVGRTGGAAPVSPSGGGAGSDGNPSSGEGDPGGVGGGGGGGSADLFTGEPGGTGGIPGMVRVTYSTALADSWVRDTERPRNPVRRAASFSPAVPADNAFPEAPYEGWHRPTERPRNPSPTLRKFELQAPPPLWLAQQPVPLDRWLGSWEPVALPRRRNPEGGECVVYALPDYPVLLPMWEGSLWVPPAGVLPRPGGFLLLPTLPPEQFDWLSPFDQPLARPRRALQVPYPGTSALVPTPWDWLDGLFPAPPRRMARPEGGVFLPGELFPAAPTPWDWDAPTGGPSRRPVARPEPWLLLPPGESVPLGWWEPAPGVVRRPVARPGTGAILPVGDPVPWDWSVPPVARPLPSGRPHAPWFFPASWFEQPAEWLTDVGVPVRAAPRRPEPPPAYTPLVVSPDWFGEAAALPVARPARRPDGWVALPPAVTAFDFGLLLGWEPCLWVPARLAPRRPHGGGFWVHATYGTGTATLAREFWVAEPGLRWWHAGVGMGVMVRNEIRKTEGDRLRLGIDWGDVPELWAGATLSSVAISASPSGLTIASQQNDTAYRTSAVFSGGAAGTTYSVTWSATLSSGSVVSRTADLKVV